MSAKSTVLIGYLRVSTRKQGDSGLGLEAQRQAIQDYARRIGATIGAFFTEIESGRKCDREELQRALSRCKRERAILCVAKMDRLSRNVAFLASLMQSGVDFVACDNPNANKLTVHVLAAVAEFEAEQISARTRAALSAYKARGGVLGAARPECRNLTDAARRLGSERSAAVARAEASAAYRDVATMMQSLRTAGLSLQQIADHLNELGESTRRGAAWNRVQVMRVLQRVAA